MPAFAPRSSVLAEKQRGESARQAHHGGDVTIAGVKYAAAVNLEPLRHVQNDAGLWEQKQTIRVVILKSLLATHPAKKTQLVHEKVTYRVDGDIAGGSDHEPAWVIHASRKLASP